MANDLISRQAAIDALDQIFDRCEEIEAHLPEGDPDRIGYKMFPDYITVWKYLHQLPSAQPERKMGKWKRRLVDSGYNVDWYCSVCKWKTSLEQHGYNYCPNCGAKMGEVES